MYMLAIETTGPNAYVALFHAENPDGGLDRRARGRAVLLGENLARANSSEKSDAAGSGSARGLRCHQEQLTHIAASVGPGPLPESASAWRQRERWRRSWAPCVAVPTLEAFLYAQAPNDADERVICGIINARRGQVYGILDGYLPGGPYLLTDVLAVITRHKTRRQAGAVYGDGIDAYEAQIISLLGDAKMEKTEL